MKFEFEITDAELHNIARLKQKGDNMKKDEFDATLWHSNMAAIYKGGRYWIVSVDMQAYLLELDKGIFVNCEDVKLDGDFY